MEHKKHRFRVYFSLIFIALLSSCASSKYSVEKAPLDKHFELNPVFTESQTGLLVYDLDEGKVLFNYNAHKHFTPASNTKLLTYYAAIKMIGDSIPSLEYCVVDDSMYFTGTGDPTLLYPKFEYGNTLNFLANESGALVYIPKTIDDARLGPGWSWDDYPYHFSAEKSTFPIYGNMAYFHKELTNDHLIIIPDYFQDHVSAIQDNSINNFSIDREEQSNDFQIRFNKTPLEIEDEIPFIYSNDLFVKLLSDTLGKPVSKQSYYPDCESQILYSVPTDSVSKHILLESDNFLAEQMLLLISNQLGDVLSSKKAIKSMMEHHLSELSEEINWVDGSGLSRYNQITPNALVVVLKYIYKEIPKDKLYSLLPVSGDTGTISSSFPNLKGKIHAKTGSMSHVYNLSGYLETNSGKTLLFSFMNNNFNVSFSELKLEMEKVLSVFVND